MRREVEKELEREREKEKEKEKEREVGKCAVAKFSVVSLPACAAQPSREAGLC